MAQERRQYKRIDERHLVAYVTRSSEAGVHDEGVALSEDLSLNGIQMALPRMAAVGDQLDLSFNIEQDLFSVVGEIVWVSPNDVGCDIGVRIVSVPKEYEAKIEHMLSENK